MDMPVSFIGPYGAGDEASHCFQLLAMDQADIHSSSGCILAFSRPAIATGSCFNIAGVKSMPVQSLLQGSEEETAPLAKDVAKLKKSQAARSVPVVAVVNGPKESGPHPFLMELVGAGVDGIALPLESLDTAAHAFGLQNASSESVDKQVSTHHLQGTSSSPLY